MAITIYHMPTLAQAIVHWLQYQRILGRDELFSEAYLGQPIGEFLLHYRDSNKSELKTEYDHPILNLAQKSGRPSQIDFIIKSLLAMTVAIEVKWFVDSPSNNSNNIKKIIHDLLRLEIMHGYKESTNNDLKIMVSNLKTKVFICAGNHYDMKKLKDIDLITEFLSFEIGDNNEEEKLININNIINSNNTNASSIIHQWLEKYTIKNIDNFTKGELLDINHYYKKISKNSEDIYNLKISEEFSTKLIANAHTNDFSVYIWQVLQYTGKKSKYYIGKDK